MIYKSTQFETFELRIIYVEILYFPLILIVTRRDESRQLCFFFFSFQYVSVENKMKMYAKALKSSIKVMFFSYFLFYFTLYSMILKQLMNVRSQSLELFIKNFFDCYGKRNESTCTYTRNAEISGFNDFKVD